MILNKVRKTVKMTVTELKSEGDPGLQAEKLNWTDCLLKSTYRKLVLGGILLNG